jgi:hypothetical protein
VLLLDEGETVTSTNPVLADIFLWSFALASSVSADSPACLGSGHARARPISTTAVSLPPASERLDIENCETTGNRPFRSYVGRFARCSRPGERGKAMVHASFDAVEPSPLRGVAAVLLAAVNRQACCDVRPWWRRRWRYRWRINKVLVTGGTD